MNRVLVTSLLATTTGAALMFAAHGCSLSIFTDYTYDEAREELSGSSGSGAGGTGGATTTSSSSGNPNCKCAADNNDCTTDLPDGEACPGADEASCHTPLPYQPCADMNDMAAFCDRNGTCTPCSECADAACKHRCVRQACEADTDCANGNCEDGFCCDSDCTGPCNGCNRVPGTCTPLPVGMVGDCQMGALCDNTGVCKSPAKVALGEKCGLAADCESGACVGQLCVSVNGQPCVENLECASRLCDLAVNKCIPCGGNNMCPGGGGCVNGTCQALPGQPAKTSSECKPPGVVADGLTCTLPVGATCSNNFECIYHDCNSAPNGVCADACQFEAECPSGTTCNNDAGWCFLPSGSFCVIDDQCQGPMDMVGVCAGFPRRCQ